MNPPSVETDLSKTFARARKRLRLEAQERETKVTQLTRKKA